MFRLEATLEVSFAAWIWITTSKFDWHTYILKEISITRQPFYHKCCSLIGYATRNHYLLCCRLSE